MQIYFFLNMETFCVLMISEAYLLILEWTLFHTSSDGLYQDPTGEEYLIGACPFLPPQATLVSVLVQSRTVTYVI